MTDESTAGSFAIVHLSAKCVGRLGQHLAAFIASLGGFTLGVCLGWNSSASVFLKETTEIGDLELVLIGGIFNIGACIGVSLMPLAVRWLRVPTLMLISMLIVFVGWGLVSFAGESVAVLIAGRVFCGFSATSCVLVPLYIGSIAETKIRGRLLASFQLLINFGVMFSFAVASLVQDEIVWRLSLASAAATALTGVVIVLPDTPIYRYMNNDEDDARKSVRFFRGYDEEKLTTEMKSVERLAKIEENRRRMSVMQLIKKKLFDVRGFVSLVGVFALFQLSGINPVIFYALMITRAGRMDIPGEKEQTLVIALAQIIGCLLCGALVDRVGRRILLIISSGVIGICLVLLGWYHSIEDPEVQNDMSWLHLFSLSLFAGFFNLGLGPIAWMLLAELFPVKPRLEVATVIVLLNWLLSLAMTLSFAELFVTVGVSRIVWLFAGICWSGTAFVIFVVPETKPGSPSRLLEDKTEDEPEERVTDTDTPTTNNQVDS